MTGGLDDSCVCGREIRTGDIAAFDDDPDADLSDIVPASHGLETDTDGRQVWRCYRRTNGDDERCLFHLSPDERRERYGLEEGQFAQVLLAAINDTPSRVLERPGDSDGYLPDDTPEGHSPFEIVTENDEFAAEEVPNLRKHRRLQFVGARLGDIDLSYERLAPPSGYNITLAGIEAEAVELPHATIENTLVLNGATLSGLNLKQAETGLVFGQRADIDGDFRFQFGEATAVRFDHTTIGGTVQAMGLQTTSNVRFDGTTVGGDVDMAELNVDGKLRFRQATVGGEFGLSDSRAETVSLYRTTVNGDVTGDGVRSGHGAHFTEMTVVGGDVSLDSLQAGSQITLNGVTVNAPGDDEPDLAEVIGDAELAEDLTDLAGDGDAEPEATGSLSIGSLEARELQAGGMDIDGDLTVDSAVVHDQAHFSPYQGTRSRIGGTMTCEYAEFDVLMLTGLTVEGTEEERSLRLTALEVSQAVGLDEIELAGTLDMQWSSVGKELSMSDGTIHGRLQLSQVSVGNDVEIDGSELTDGIDLSGGTVGSGVEVSTSAVGGIHLPTARVGGHIRVVSTQVDSGLGLRSATVENGFSVVKSGIAGGVSLVQADLGTLVCRNSEITGGAFDVRHATVSGDIRVEISRLSGGIKLTETTTAGRLTVDGTTVGESFVLTRGSVNNGVRVTRSSVHARFRCDDADIDGGLEVVDTTVTKATNCKRADIDQAVVFTRVSLGGSLDLSGAAIAGELGVGDGTYCQRTVSLSGTTVTDGVSFSGAVVERAIRIDEGAEMENLELREGTRFGRLLVCGATVRRRLLVRDCRSLLMSGGGVFVSNSRFWRVSVGSRETADSATLLGGPFLLQDSHVEDRLELPADPFAHPAVRGVSLAGSHVTEAVLSLGDAEAARDGVAHATFDVAPLAHRSESTDLVYDFTDATVGKLETTDAASCEENPFDQFRFLTTSFDEFRFGQHRADFEQTDWQLHRTRRWGARDLGVVTTRRSERRRAPDSVVLGDDEQGLDRSLSPRFAAAHGEAVRRLADEIDDGADPSGTLLAELSDLRVDAPVAADGTGRRWRTDATADADPGTYSDLEQRLLAQPMHDITGVVISTARRLRGALATGFELPEESEADDRLSDTERAPDSDSIRDPEAVQVDALTRTALQSCYWMLEHPEQVQDLRQAEPDRTLGSVMTERTLEELPPRVEPSAAQEAIESALTVLTQLYRELQADGESSGLLIDALGSLLEAAAADEPLETTLADWAYEPAVRVRNDVWNAATIAAYSNLEDADPVDDRTRLKELEGTYTLAKRSAADVGENTAASKFHAAERGYARRLHRADSRTIAYLQNTGLRWLTGYGERPQWVVLWAVVVMGVWSVLYWVAQRSLDVLSGASLLELVVFSIGSFATMLPTSPLDGTMTVEATAVELLSEVEALLGVFLVAVFVFTLTRSLQR